MELLGNLLDNACKYGRGRVRIGFAAEETRLRLSVEDDGRGISTADRESVLQRGRRLDTGEPGQGIGLAVVREILDRYDGEMTIGESALGGARIDITVRG